jgi:dTDP-4-amino-4,6-dideoxygalactose transaminase
MAPAAELDSISQLLQYTEIDSATKPYWVTNGKISEVSCAHLLDRLETVEEWGARYYMQKKRIIGLAEKAGYTPLLNLDNAIPAMSLPFLADQPIAIESLKNNLLVLAKYYKPLAETTNAMDIFNRIVCIPSHPDVARISTEELSNLLASLHNNSCV